MISILGLPGILLLGMSGFAPPAPLIGALAFNLIISWRLRKEQP